MEIVEIDGYKSLTEKLKGTKKAWLLLYKSGNEPSLCALENLTNAAREMKDMTVLKADVAAVRDIHPNYQVKSVPSLISFENGEYKNVIKGCQPADYYQNLLEEAAFFSQVKGGDDKPVKRVTVYSTPTCSWCTTLKTHLRKHQVRFTDVDVSKDQAAAQAMVAKSGQQGVPQTDINGEIIVGFDKNRINKLLNIQG